MQANITKRTVDAATPGACDLFVWDTKLKGFGLKVTPAGRKVYIIQYRPGGGRNAPVKRYTIGLHGSPWTPESARQEAGRLLAEVKHDADPAARRQADRKAVTVAELAERLMTEHVAVKRKAGTVREYRRLVDQIIVPAIGRRPVKDLTRAEIEVLHSAHRDTPYQANRVLALLSKMMNWGEKRGLRQEGTNPCRHVERFAEGRRERFLSPRELARLGRALAVAERCGRASPWQAAAIRLLVFTGARLSEILTARWEWFSPERSTLELPDSKTGRRTIYLPAPALEVLAELPREKGNLFIIVGAAPGMHLVNLSKLWRRTRKAALLPDVRLHDLRHSHASVAAAAGLSLPVIGALLGHAQAATTQRYAHLSADPLKAASGLIAERIAAAMRPAKGEGEVVPIRSRR
jgi:integrase